MLEELFKKVESGLVDVVQTDSGYKIENGYYEIKKNNGVLSLYRNKELKLSVNPIGCKMQGDAVRMSFVFGACMEACGEIA